MNMDILLTGLVLVSALTGVATEAVKMLLDAYNKSYKSEVLAGIVALVLSVALGAGYAFYMDVTVDARYIIGVVAFVFLSWLIAMVGYDKVIGAITKKGE